MYAIYGNIYHQYTPVMLAYIPAPWILWDMEKIKAMFQTTNRMEFGGQTQLATTVHDTGGYPMMTAMNL